MPGSRWLGPPNLWRIAIVYYLWRDPLELFHKPQHRFLDIRKAWPSCFNRGRRTTKTKCRCSTDSRRRMNRPIPLSGRTLEKNPSGWVANRTVRVVDGDRHIQRSEIARGLREWWLERERDQHHSPVGRRSQRDYLALFLTMRLASWTERVLCEPSWWESIWKHALTVRSSLSPCRPDLLVIRWWQS